MIKRHSIHLFAQSFVIKILLQNSLVEKKKQKENDDENKNFLGASDVDINNQIIEGQEQSI